MNKKIEKLKNFGKGPKILIGASVTATIGAAIAVPITIANKNNAKKTDGKTTASSDENKSLEDAVAKLTIDQIIKEDEIHLLETNRKKYYSGDVEGKDVSHWIKNAITRISGLKKLPQKDIIITSGNDGETVTIEIHNHGDRRTFTLKNFFTKTQYEENKHGVEKDDKTLNNDDQAASTDDDKSPDSKDDKTVSTADDSTIQDDSNDDSTSTVDAQTTDEINSGEQKPQDDQAASTDDVETADSKDNKTVSTADDSTIQDDSNDDSTSTVDAQTTDEINSGEQKPQDDQAASTDDVETADSKDDKTVSTADDSTIQDDSNDDSTSTEDKIDKSSKDKINTSKKLITDYFAKLQPNFLNKLKDNRVFASNIKQEQILKYIKEDKAFSELPQEQKSILDNYAIFLSPDDLNGNLTITIKGNEEELKTWNLMNSFFMLKNWTTNLDDPNSSLKTKDDLEQWLKNTKKAVKIEKQYLILHDNNNKKIMSADNKRGSVETWTTESLTNLLVDVLNVELKEGYYLTAHGFKTSEKSPKLFFKPQSGDKDIIVDDKSPDSKDDKTVSTADDSTIQDDSNDDSTSTVDAQTTDEINSGEQKPQDDQAASTDDVETADSKDNKTVSTADDSTIQDDSNDDSTSTVDAQTTDEINSGEQKPQDDQAASTDDVETADSKDDKTVSTADDSTIQDDSNDDSTSTEDKIDKSSKDKINTSKKLITDYFAKLQPNFLNKLKDNRVFASNIKQEQILKYIKEDKAFSELPQEQKSILDNYAIFLSPDDLNGNLTITIKGNEEELKTWNLMNSFFMLKNWTTNLDDPNSSLKTKDDLEQWLKNTKRAVKLEKQYLILHDNNKALNRTDNGIGIGVVEIWTTESLTNLLVDILNVELKEGYYLTAHGFKTSEKSPKLFFKPQSRDKDIVVDDKSPDSKDDKTVSTADDSTTQDDSNDDSTSTVDAQTTDEINSGEQKPQDDQAASTDDVETADSKDNKTVSTADDSTIQDDSNDDSTSTVDAQTTDEINSGEQKPQDDQAASTDDVETADSKDDKTVSTADDSTIQDDSNDDSTSTEDKIDKSSKDKINTSKKLITDYFAKLQPNFLNKLKDNRVFASNIKQEQILKYIKEDKAFSELPQEQKSILDNYAIFLSPDDLNGNLTITIKGNEEELKTWNLMNSFFMLKNWTTNLDDPNSSLKTKDDLEQWLKNTKKAVKIEKQYLILHDNNNKKIMSADNKRGSVETWTTESLTNLLVDVLNVELKEGYYLTAHGFKTSEKSPKLFFKPQSGDKDIIVDDKSPDSKDDKTVSTADDSTIQDDSNDDSTSTVDAQTTDEINSGEQKPQDDQAASTVSDTTKIADVQNQSGDHDSQDDDSNLSEDIENKDEKTRSNPDLAKDKVADDISTGGYYESLKGIIKALPATGVEGITPSKEIGVNDITDSSLKKAITEINGLTYINKDKIIIKRDNDAGTITINIIDYGIDKVITLSGYLTQAQADAMKSINGVDIPEYNGLAAKDLYDYILVAKSTSIKEITLVTNQNEIDKAKQDGTAKIQSAIKRYKEQLSDAKANEEHNQTLKKLKTALQDALGNEKVKSTKTKDALENIDLEKITKNTLHTSLGITKDLSFLKIDEGHLSVTKDSYIVSPVAGAQIKYKIELVHSYGNIEVYLKLETSDFKSSISSEDYAIVESSVLDSNKDLFTLKGLNDQSDKSWTEVKEELGITSKTLDFILENKGIKINFQSLTIYDDDRVEVTIIVKKEGSSPVKIKLKLKSTAKTSIYPSQKALIENEVFSVIKNKDYLTKITGGNDKSWAEVKEELGITSTTLDSILENNGIAIDYAIPKYITDSERSSDVKVVLTVKKAKQTDVTVNLYIKSNQNETTVKQNNQKRWLSALFNDNNQFTEFITSVGKKSVSKVTDSQILEYIEKKWLVKNSIDDKAYVKWDDLITIIKDDINNIIKLKLRYKLFTNNPIKQLEIQIQKQATNTSYNAIQKFIGINDTNDAKKIDSEFTSRFVAGESSIEDKYYINTLRKNTYNGTRKLIWENIPILKGVKYRQNYKIVLSKMLDDIAQYDKKAYNLDQLIEHINTNSDKFTKIRTLYVSPLHFSQDSLDFKIINLKNANQQKLILKFSWKYNESTSNYDLLLRIENYNTKGHDDAILSFNTETALINEVVQNLPENSFEGIKPINSEKATNFNAEDLKNIITQTSGLSSVDRRNITILQDDTNGTITITIKGYGVDKTISLSGYQKVVDHSQNGSDSTNVSSQTASDVNSLTDSTQQSNAINPVIGSVTEDSEKIYTETAS